MKVVKKWKPEADGNVREQTEKTAPAAQVGSDLDLQNTFIRRGLAMDVGLLMSYKIHEKLHMELIKAKLRTPPPGYAKISLAQIGAADEMAFQLWAEATRKGIRGVTAQGTVLDSKIDAVLVDPQFHYADHSFAPCRGQAAVAFGASCP